MMAKNYIFQGKNAAQYQAIPCYESLEDPFFTYVSDGTVLPAKADPVLPWGKGGVLGSDGMFINESALDDSFGGSYDFNPEEVDTVGEEAIYLGILPRHWGHFLIDVLCKLWSPMIHEHRCKIVYCGLDWQSSGGVDGVYLQLLELAGISKENLLYITKPTRFSKLLIPSRTLGFEKPWNKYYRDVIARIVEKAEEQASRRGLRACEKLYLSRTGFSAAKRSEVGEDRLEQLFRTNGYTIVSPETLDAVEQIHLYHNCLEFASLSGTLAHNLVFANPDVHAVILNRTWALNPPQIRINQAMGIDPSYVDVYDEGELNLKSDYKARNYSVHLLSVNSNLRQWCLDNGLHNIAEGPEITARLKYEMLRLFQAIRSFKHRIANPKSK